MAGWRLVGRERELKTLRSIAVATVKGAGGRAVLTGTPGMGKTSLLEALRQDLPRGLTAAAGRATELDRVTPLSSLIAALEMCEGLRPGLARIGSYRGDPGQYVERIGELLDEYTVRQPLLISIDDMQWADETSTSAVRILVSELSSSPVMWLFARRPEASGAPGQRAVAWLLANGATEIVLELLDDEAVRKMCRDHLGADPDPRLLALITRAGGHPLLIKHLLDGLRGADRLVIRSGVASVIGEDLPRNVVAAVQLGLQQRSPRARRLLEAGSIFIGRPFTVHAAAELLRVPAGELAEAVPEVMLAGLLQERGFDLVFCHDLVREVVYDDIPEPVRTARHREAVAVVLDEGRSIVEAAEHVLRSGPRRDREAVTLLRGAADEIAGRAPGTAADYLVYALQIMGTYDPYWPALAAEAVNLLMSAGRLEEATPLGEAALQGELAPDTRAMLLLGLAEGGKHSGQNRAAVEYARRGLSIEEISDPVRARLYGLASHALLYVGDGSGAAEAGMEAIRLGDRTGEHSASVFGKVALSVVTRTEGRLDESLVWAQRAVEHAERVGGEALHRHPGIWLGNALESLDRLAEARKAYVHAQQEAERLGTAWSRPLSHFHLACLLAGLGRLEDAVNEAEAGLSVADRLSAVQLSVPLHGLLAVIAVLRNEHPVAREHLRQLDRLQDDGVTAAPELTAWPRAVLAEGRRDPQTAMTHLGPVYDALPGRLLLFAYHPGCGPAMVRMALTAGDHQRADAAAAAAQLMADRHPGVPSLVGGAQHAKALLREDPATFGKAIETLRQGLRPLMLANALEDAAEAEYRAGSRSNAVEYLQEALDIYLPCGARQAVERVRRRRPVIGVTHSTEDDPNPTSPLDRLTPTERDVAHWVAQGMTNRQVARQLSISPHTVDTNLRKIFGKLGIGTRVELTRIVTDEERDSR